MIKDKISASIKVFKEQAKTQWMNWKIEINDNFLNNLTVVDICLTVLISNRFIVGLSRYDAHVE